MRRHGEECRKERPCPTLNVRKNEVEVLHANKVRLYGEIHSGPGFRFAGCWRFATLGLGNSQWADFTQSATGNDIRGQPCPAKLREMPDRNPENFARWVNRGLGRAVLWLRDHPWQPHEAAITHVCLHDTVYCHWTEANRACYTLAVIQATGAPEHFADKLQVALTDRQANRHDQEHRFAVACLLVQEGYLGLRNTMYQRLDFPESENEMGLLGHLIWLDKGDGFRFAMGRVGRVLLTKPNLPIDDYLLFDANDILGDEAAREIVESARRDENVRRYLDAPKTSWSGDAPPDRDREWETQPYAQARQRILEDGPKGWGARAWARKASEYEWREAAADLLSEKDEAHVEALLGVFDRRPFPLDPQPLIGWAESPNLGLARAARRALEELSSEGVRQLAIRLAERSAPEIDSIDLFAGNFQPGDESLIQNVIAAQQNENALHYACLAAIKVAENNRNGEFTPLLLQIYESTPCSRCRQSATDELKKRDAMPAWMLRELEWDCVQLAGEEEDTASP